MHGLQLEVERLQQKLLTADQQSADVGRENAILKQQLKQYMAAVQMIKSPSTQSRSFRSFLAFTNTDLLRGNRFETVPFGPVFVSFDEEAFRQQFLGPSRPPIRNPFEPYGLGIRRPE